LLDAVGMLSNFFEVFISGVVITGFIHRCACLSCFEFLGTEYNHELLVSFSRGYNPPSFHSPLSYHHQIEAKITSQS
jgi:hypothetical protein